MYRCFCSIDCEYRSAGTALAIVCRLSHGHSVSIAMAESPGKSSGSPDRAFITEVARLGSPSGRQRSHRPSNTLQAVCEKDDSGVRSAERINTKNAAADVFRIIDRFGEKQKHSKNIRSLIQKAAQKTILVVRTKNATQAAENVTIRFNKNHITEPPRSVALSDVCLRVLANVVFSSNRKRYLFYDVFENVPEMEAVLKDLFWYLTAHCFQPGRNKTAEDNYYQRIADNFTALFIRVQVQPASRDSGFFDMLPDVIAQIMFVALYEGFPKSRKSMVNTDLRKQILKICYAWILGFVPADLDCSKWMAVDQESPKRIAALADFPAMRNRMLRAERIERTKQEVKNRHGSILDETEEVEEFSEDYGDDEERDRDKLPSLHSNQTHAPNHLQVETHERRVYQMQNSPLVDAFLKRHNLEANASHLKVQLRLTSGKHFDLSNQEALHATTLPRERRRRLANPKSYAEALDKIEGFGDSVRSAYASEKKKMHDRDAAEKRLLVEEQRELEMQFSALKTRNTKIHEYSNLIVSKGRIDALVPANDGPTQGSMAGAAISAPGRPPLGGLTPRPPPPRTISNSVQRRLE